MRDHRQTVQYIAPEDYKMLAQAELLVIDEAAAKLKMEMGSKPTELEDLDREILQKDIECEALKKETDGPSADRLSELLIELKELKGRSNKLTSQWNQELGNAKEIGNNRLR